MIEINLKKPMNFDDCKQSLTQYLSIAEKNSADVKREPSLFRALTFNELYSFIVNPIDLSTYRQKEIEELLEKFYRSNEPRWLEEIYGIWSTRMIANLGPYPIYQEEAYHLLENSMHLLKDFLYETFQTNQNTRDHIEYIYRNNLNTYLVNLE